MTINEAITAVLSASHHGDQYFRKFLLGDDPEVVRMRDALMQLEDAVREYPDDPQMLHDPLVINRFFIGWDNSKPPQLWVFRGDHDESAEPWMRVVF